MMDGIINHFKTYGIVYIIMTIITVFFSVLMIIWRKIILSGKKIEYTILRPNGNPIRGKVSPKEESFQLEGSTYLVEQGGITHREGFFGHVQTIMFYEKIPHPIKIEKIEKKDLYEMKIIRGDTLSEILEHKLVKEFLELHDSGQNTNWIAIIGGIVVFIIFIGIIAFIVLKATSGGA